MTFYLVKRVTTTSDKYAPYFGSKRPKWLRADD